jgi:glutamyl-tRNA reductase
MQHEVLLVGLNHRTAAVGVREAVAFGDEQILHE